MIPLPPKVSVMIPTYNQARFVERAMRSALEQDYANLEIMVADDCSTDATRAVVEDFISRYGQGRIAYFRNSENLGILRNYHVTLVTRTSGDWVINLDADDFFVDRDFISKAVRRTQDDPAVVLVFGSYCEYSEATGERIAIASAGDMPMTMNDREFFERYAAGGVRWNHNSILYRREEAIRIGCYWHECIPRNDWESFLRLIVGRKAGYLDSTAAAWVQHPGNETRRLDLAKYLNNFNLIRGVTRFALDRGMDAGFIQRWERRMLANSAKDSCIAYIRNRDWRGLATFVACVRKVRPSLPFRLALDPGLVGRAVLASSPRLYGMVKRQVGQAKR